MADIKHVFYIKASFSNIFEAVSTIKGLKNWWTEDTTGDDHVGGIIRFGFTPGVQADFKVAYKDSNMIEFVYHGHKEDEWFNTKIIIRLAKTSEHVKVDFQHIDFAVANDFYGQCNFTWGRYLQSLKDFCEKGKGAPFRK